MSAPTIARPADTYTWDGITYDRAVPLRDRHGTTWRWTGTPNEAGEPLLAADDGLGEMPLPDLYRDGWPLRPVAPSLPAGLGALLAQPRRPVELPPATGRECAVCPGPVPAGRAHCSRACRDIDDPHDDHDTPEDD